MDNVSSLVLVPVANQKHEISIALANGMDESSKHDEREKIEEKVCSSESEDFSTSTAIKEALKDLPEALNFIIRLQECILRQRTLIYRLYAKLKDEGQKKKTTVLTKDETTQTSEDDFLELSANTKPEKLVEDIKRAAENAVHQTGFAYEASSGMYYDYNTGYYYNAELGLYYDGHNGIYYYLDESSKTFQFHSQVPVASQMLPSNNEASEVPVTPQILPSNDAVSQEPVTPQILPSNDEAKPLCQITSPPSTAKRKEDLTNIKDIKEEIPKKKIKLETKEEGECSDSSSDEENETETVPTTCDTLVDNDESKDCVPKMIVDNHIPSNDEIAKAWPPCLRVVVKETKLDNLLVGSLFIVTCTGGTMGREGDHAIIIPDINISKHHARVSFSEEEKCYMIVDLGSRNGTYVDGRRISVALRESEPVALQHGSVVRVGTTRLECHVHAGRDTCEQCEPGCAQTSLPESGESIEKDDATKEARHRSELRRLRKRFGLDKLSAKEIVPSLADGYKDRAEERRKTVGSHDHNEKTETASVHQSIKSTNKGFKMLSKMGWAEGQALGKDSSKGITEPVAVEQRADKAGLGADTAHLPATDLRTRKKAEVWKKAQQRFQELDEQ